MTVKRSAALFPGQGAYFPGALASVKNDTEIRDILREIDEVTQRLSGDTVSELLLTADAPSIDELLESNPDLLQMAIYGTSVSAHRVLRARGVRPDVLVGHSFGEIAALVCAGGFSVGSGAEIVGHRNAALRAVGELDGYLLALSADVVESQQILELVGDPQTVIAVENHDRQTVIAGPRASVDTAAAVAAALRLGAVPLKSPYPFHGPMLRDAAFDFACRMRHLPQGRMDVEVYSPILGRAYQDTDKLTAVLAGHLTRPVRFATALRALGDAGVDSFVECGSLDTLTKITSRVLGAGPSLVPLLRPGASLAEFDADSIVAQSSMRDADGLEAVRRGLAPGLAPAEFERLWRSCVEQIVRFTISEYSAAANAPALTGPPNHDPVGGAEPGTVSLAEASRPLPEPLPEVPPPAEVPPPLPEAPPRDVVFHELVSLYADALEYPPEVFDEDTDLEAELGVDSVKQTELLRRVGETFRLGPLPSDFKLGEHNTLGRIADMIAAV